MANKQHLSGWHEAGGCVLAIRATFLLFYFKRQEVLLPLTSLTSKTSAIKALLGFRWQTLIVSLPFDRSCHGLCIFSFLFSSNHFISSHYTLHHRWTWIAILDNCIPIPRTVIPSNFAFKMWEIKGRASFHGFVKQSTSNFSPYNSPFLPFHVILPDLMSANNKGNFIISFLPEVEGRLDDRMLCWNRVPFYLCCLDSMFSLRITNRKLSSSKEVFGI